MTEKMTNVELIEYFMTFSKSGALAQAFVMEALWKYSELMINSEPWDTKHSVVSYEAWKATAQELNDLLKKNYGEFNDKTSNGS